jgi:hypothetical protein
MDIKHDKETGALSFHFSWKEILILITKKKLIFNVHTVKDLSTLIFTAVLENIKSKKYDDKK